MVSTFDRPPKPLNSESVESPKSQRSVASTASRSSSPTDSLVFDFPSPEQVDGARFNPSLYTSRRQNMSLATKAGSLFRVQLTFDAARRRSARSDIDMKAQLLQVYENARSRRIAFYSAAYEQTFDTKANHEKYIRCLFEEIHRYHQQHFHNSRRDWRKSCRRIQRAIDEAADVLEGDDTKDLYTDAMMAIGRHHLFNALPRR